MNEDLGKHNRLKNLELLKNEVHDDIKYCFSNKQILFILYKYFSEVLRYKNEVIRLLYISEFLNEYLKCLKDYEVYYLKSYYTELILAQINDLTKLDIDDKLKEELRESYKQIEDKFANLEGLLKGDKVEHSSSLKKLFFPVIEENCIKENQIPFGVLESITIDIKKNPEDVFIVIPSGKLIEENINRQIQISYKVALEYVKKQLKIKIPTHTIIINFDKRLGDYTGNSLGIALTIGFIDKLLHLYNSPYFVHIKEDIASTGGVDPDWKILTLHEDIIKEKTEILFFSSIKTFIVPEENKKDALKKVEELKRNYPFRELEIEGVNNLNDLLNRRNLIDIKKQNIVARSSKILLTNKISLMLLIILVSLISLNIFVNFDDNPYEVVDKGNSFLIVNKSGKILWTIKNLHTVPNSKVYLDSRIRIIDCNKDGINEVLYTKGPNDNSIICFDKNRNIVWTHTFEDKLVSPREVMDPVYSSFLFDTLSIKGRTYICCTANNASSFASALYFIDISNGSRYSKTLYNPGHYSRVIVKKKKDDDYTLYISSHNNGYEVIGLIILDLNDIGGCIPTIPDYMINNLPNPKVLRYFLFPKTDLANYNKVRINGTKLEFFREDPQGNLISLRVVENDDYRYEMFNIEYKLEPDLITFSAYLGNRFRVERDSLVKKGILSPPYSDTKEYRQQLVDNILYYVDGKFVKREEYLKRLSLLKPGS